MLRAASNFSSRQGAHPAESLALGFFRRAVQCVPHPNKVATGGEDAYLATDYVLGVADGVGSWGSRGVNPGLYAETLMRSAYDFCESEFLGNDCVPCAEMLKAAYDDCRTVTGSSTALFAGLCGSTLEVVSIGDCTAIVLRQGEQIFKNEEQYHSLNFPYQLGTNSADLPEDAERSKIPLQLGDIVILGSDGIFDNVYDSEVTQILAKAIDFTQQEVVIQEFTRHDGRQAQETVSFLLPTARSLDSAITDVINKATANVNDPRVPTPFAEKCIEAGAYHEGGKDDDMTMIVACVGPDTTAAMFANGERSIRDDDDASSMPAPYKHWP